MINVVQKLQHRFVICAQERNQADSDGILQGKRLL